MTKIIVLILCTLAISTGLYAQSVFRRGIIIGEEGVGIDSMTITDGGPVLYIEGSVYGLHEIIPQEHAGPGFVLLLVSTITTLVVVIVMLLIVLIKHGNILYR